jgi:transcriptional regulator with XRE-family HTH domain
MGDNRDICGDVREEIREFLTTRRAKITPEQAGLPVFGGDRRRVSGLRRDEVALLAGISSQYYTRLERGNATGVSDSVIDGIADACSSTRPSGLICST